jgi:glucose-6-phosphate-specific signal transduction histidine kinase
MVPPERRVVSDSGRRPRAGSGHDPYEADALRLEVSDDGRTHDGAPAGGYGLIGMRERVGLYGGHLQAAPGPVGLIITARLPLEGHAR